MRNKDDRSQCIHNKNTTLGLVALSPDYRAHRGVTFRQTVKIVRRTFHHTARLTSGKKRFVQNIRMRDIITKLTKKEKISQPGGKLRYTFRYMKFSMEILQAFLLYHVKGPQSNQNIPLLLRVRPLQLTVGYTGYSLQRHRHTHDTDTGLTGRSCRY